MSSRIRRLRDETRSGVEAMARDRPQETRWSIAGAIAGLLFGLIFGGVGIAALGGAFGLSGLIAFPVLFGVIGNRIGIGRDRKALLTKH